MSVLQLEKKEIDEILKNKKKTKSIISKINYLTKKNIITPIIDNFLLYNKSYDF